MKHYAERFCAIAAVLVLSLFATGQTATQTANPEIDQIAQQVLSDTGVPSASIAVVKDGKVLYVNAYGKANLEQNQAATPSMRYSIGSISKQFTASAILLLEEQGKLSINDPVSKFVPGLTRGNEVTIRELLSHTSGYQDYWPQDYVMPEMLQPVTAQQIIDKWAKKPLDFDPGTKWQYSNTNYVIAGMIVEKAAGMPLMQFLKQHIFTPLHMDSIYDTNLEKLPPGNPIGYMRYALGPLRPAPKEGKGWMFAAGELAMTPADLAKWDISMIDQTVLKPESYHELETDVELKNGVATGYGLGVDVGSRGGHRIISHTGEVSGFTAANLVFPDDRVAVAVLTNQDAVGAGSQIAQRIAGIVLKNPQPASPKETEEARQVLVDLQQGRINRSLFTDNANFYFNETCLKDFASSIGSLGPIQDFNETRESLRGGMTQRIFTAHAGTKTLTVNSYWMPDGKIEQYIVTGRD